MRLIADKRILISKLIIRGGSIHAISYREFAVTLDTTTWAIYDNPYIYSKDGTLTVNDGKEGFTVDFTGDLPVYKAWTRPVAAK